MTASAYLSGYEISLPEDSFIVTKTDLHGNITYANRVFMKLTGYSEPELLGQPQNLVRHPSMPKGIFHLLWQQISQEKECFAYINNRAKNGDNYWVFANISPMHDQNQKHFGYYSCRRQASQSAINTLKPYYEHMLMLEKHAPEDRGIHSMKWFLQQIQTDYGCYEKFILAI